MMAPADITSVAGRIVLDSLWQGVLLTSVAALGLRLAPGLSAATRFSVWALTVFAIVALPLMTAIGGPAATGSARPALHLSPMWGIALAGIWLMLCLGRLVELMLGARHLIAVARGAQPIVAAPALAAVLAASARPVQLCTSAAVDAPCVAGFGSARLLLPEGLVSSLEDADLQAVVLHELEHLRRRDDWFNLASKLAIALFPFNPALVWLDRRLGLERELACDASVVATTRAPLRYAGSLTRLAEHRVARRVAFVLAAWGRHSEMVQRVSALLGPRVQAPPWRRRAAIALVSTSLVATCGALLRAPEFVSFAGSSEGESRLTMADGGRPAVANHEQLMAVPVVFHPRQSAAPLRRVRTRTPGFDRRAAHPSASFDRGLSPASALAARAVLTSSGGRASRNRHTPSTQASAQLLQTDFPAYAAVPFGDGWLLVQL